MPDVNPTAIARSAGKPSRYDAVTFRACEPAKDFSEWVGVWVIAEHRDGKLRDITLELLGAARPMAQKLKQDVTAVILGHEVGDLPKQLVAAGADHVLVCEHPIL